MGSPVAAYLVARREVQSAREGVSAREGHNT